MAGKQSLVIFILHIVLVGFCIGHVVETNSGKVKGIKVKSIINNEQYYSFLGIPYAKPPVGDLRFMAPQPHPGWNEIYSASKEKKHCVQFSLPKSTGNGYGFCGDEDCLYLSIHTPRLPTSEELKLPVIVYFYNEYFKITHNGTKDYTPDFFMKENTIIVTINYRVGAMGFLSFEDDLLPGNNGLRDVILGLKWIQTNIDRFGGNPSKVTLMGSDGGAALVDILLHSPKAKGLFSGAILQSGTSWSSTLFNVKEKGKYRAKALAETLKIQYGSSSLLIRELSRLSSKQIVESEHESIFTDDVRIIHAIVLAFSPVIEHDHPDAVITKFPDPADVTVPVMIGYNSREALESVERYLRKPNYLTFADRDFAFFLPIRVNYRFELNTKAMFEAIQEIKDFYFDEGYVKISRPGELITYLTDSMSFYSIDYTVRKYINESAAPVFYYVFDYSGELNMRKKRALDGAQTTEGTWGAAIGDDLCYLFVCKPIIKEYKKILKDPESEELKVITNMVNLWSNFAKTGNPTPSKDGEFVWIPASQENKECLVISDELEMKTKLYEDRIQFWDKFLAKYQEKAVNGVIGGTKDEL